MLCSRAKKFFSHDASLHPGVEMGTSVNPAIGSGNSFSCFMLKKQEISAGLMVTWPVCSYLG